MEEIFNHLTAMIKEHQQVILMTHKNPDLDGLSSAICLYQIITSFHKDCYLYMPVGKLHSSVVKMFEKLEQNQVDLEIIHKYTAKKYIDANPLLIIIDVSNETIVENPKSLKKTSNIIVLDHHIKSKNYIKNTKFSYINSNLSSMVEFMTSYTKYLNKPLSPVLATIMLAAIEIDTNSFNLKTTEATYETAAYLAKMGADNIEKQELLKESKEDYLKRHDFLKSSYMVTPSIAMCRMDDNIYSKTDLALLAKELLLFDAVEASIVIGKTGKDKISISSRSIGKINVEAIMAKIGGGGHATEAAAELEETSIHTVVKEITRIIKEG